MQVICIAFVTVSLTLAISVVIFLLLLEAFIVIRMRTNI